MTERVNFLTNNRRSNKHSPIYSNLFLLDGTSFASKIDHAPLSAGFHLKGRWNRWRGGGSLITITGWRRLVFTEKAFTRTRAPQQLHILSILSLTRGNIGRLHEQQHRHRLSIHTSPPFLPPSTNLAVVHKRLVVARIIRTTARK